MDGDYLDKASSFVSHKVTISFISQVHGPWALLICQLKKKYCVSTAKVEFVSKDKQVKVHESTTL